MLIKGLLLTFITMLLYVLSSFLILPTWGELIGGVCFVSYFIFLSINLKEFFVFLYDGEITDKFDKKVLGNLLNLGFGNINIFKSEDVETFHLIPSFQKKSLAIILNEEFFSELNNSEIEVLTTRIKEEIISGLFKYRTLVIINYILVFTPMLLLRSISKKIFKPVNLIYSFVFYPLIVLMNKITISINSSLNAENNDEQLLYKMPQGGDLNTFKNCLRLY